MVRIKFPPDFAIDINIWISVIFKYEFKSKLPILEHKVSCRNDFCSLL